MKQSTTADRVRQLLSYDAETGVFRWLKSRGRVRAGAIAGADRSGYLSIQVDGTCYPAHRLAWLYVNGEWPADQIDHIDGRRANNAIRNLRQVNNAENLQNRYSARADNKAGALGVRARGSRWHAQIAKHGKAFHLGTFSTREEAHAAYVEAKRHLHPMGML